MTKSSPSAADTERIIIGKVGKPHGIKGDLIVYPLTDFPERFDNLPNVTVGDELLTVKSLKWHGTILLMRFGDYDTRETAAQLTGKLLSVPSDDRMPLAEGEYYTADIIGMQVFDEADSLLGEIVEILTTGANDVYVVRRVGTNDLLLPALKKVVLNIDIVNKKMLVRLQPEL